MNKDLLDVNKLTRQQLAIMRVKCDRDLLYFTRLFHYALKGTKFILNSHHEVIADNLKKIENYEIELLNINIPPRFSKTLLCAVNFIARGIGMNPLSNWLYITASDELRSQTSIEIRDIVTHPLFKVLYGVELKKDQNGKNLWRTKEGGGLKTATIFGQITGFGAGIMRDNENNELIDYIKQFDGSIVIDDANKTDDSETENANNEKVHRVFFNTILSRKNTANTPIINIQQRAGLSDLTAKLKEHYGDSDKAVFLVMPVISEDGVPLWEWKHNLEAINKLRTSPLTAHTFETQYMQNPLPRFGVMFVKEQCNWFKMSDINPEFIQARIGNIDVADTGKDYYSFPSGVLIGEKFYVTEWLYTQENTDFTRPQTSAIANKNKIEHLGLETNNMGMEFGRRLKPELSPFINLYPKAAPNNTSKITRIINKAEFIRQHFVFRNDVLPNSDYDKALNHLFRFMKDGSFKIDDAPDSLAGLARLIENLEFPQFRNI